MCGRFDFHGDSADIEAVFGASAAGKVLRSSYNIAPTEAAPCIFCAGGVAGVALGRFGWQKGFIKGGLVINARAETVLERPMFRRAFSGQRCVIPAHGFFEWQKSGKQRQPWYFTSAQCPIFGLAGIYEPATTGSGIDFIILTTEPNEKVASYHNRMPVILPPEEALAFVTGPVDAAAAMLVPYPAEGMHARKVSQAMNRAGYDGPECVEPI